MKKKNRIFLLITIIVVSLLIVAICFLFFFITGKISLDHHYKISNITVSNYFMAVDNEPIYENIDSAIVIYYQPSFSPNRIFIIRSDSIYIFHRTSHVDSSMRINRFLTGLTKTTFDSLLTSFSSNFNNTNIFNRCLQIGVAKMPCIKLLMYGYSDGITIGVECRLLRNYNVFHYQVNKYWDKRYSKLNETIYELLNATPGLYKDDLLNFQTSFKEGLH